MRVDRTQELKKKEKNLRNKDKCQDAQRKIVLNTNIIRVVKKRNENYQENKMKL